MSVLAQYSSYTTVVCLFSLALNPVSPLDTEAVQLHFTMYLTGDCSRRAAVMPQLPGSFPELVVSQLDIQPSPLLPSHAVLI